MCSFIATQQITFMAQWREIEPEHHRARKTRSSSPLQFVPVVIKTLAPFGHQ